MSSNKAASPMVGQHVRVKVNFRGQCTLLGFPREDPLPIEELISKTCTRMQLTGSVSEYALFVAHGRTNIRVFESSDLKDEDECELVLVHYDDDDGEEEIVESDDDDKTVPMSAEKVNSDPEKEPESEVETPPAKKRKANNGKKNSKQSSAKKPSPPTERTTRSSVGSASSSSPPPRRNVSTQKRRGKKKSSRKSQDPNGLVRVTKKNKFKLEPGTMLVFDRFSDGHYHEAVVQKYLPPEKQEKEPDTCWIFVQNVEQDLPEKSWKKTWIDLNSFKSYIVDRGNILGIDDDDDLCDSPLGKRLSVKWSDGNFYEGTVTKTLISDTDFVFIDYDDGDECWSDLLKEKDANEIKESISRDKKPAG